MPTPFKDLEFSFKQVRILRKLRDLLGLILNILFFKNTTLLIMIPNAMTFTVRATKL